MRWSSIDHGTGFWENILELSVLFQRGQGALQPTLSKETTKRQDSAHRTKNILECTAVRVMFRARMMDGRFSFDEMIGAF